MTAFAALFRGINVGGHNILPMKELRALLAGLGYQSVQTYIQSGNAMFEAEGDADEIAKAIRQGVAAASGFSPEVLVMGRRSLEQAAASNPFPEAEMEPKTLHLYFLAEDAAAADLAGMEAKKTDSERYVLKGRVFYLHAPDGIGRSKLAASVEKHLGVRTTARNWNTVQRLLKL